MGLLTIDPEKCKRDGVCVETCPARLLVLEGREDVPAAIPGAEELCIDCGHCVAVCPHGALSHRAMTAEECPPIQKELQIDARQAEQFLRSRRSVRVYRDEPLDRETLVKLIRIARYAPSGHNAQPVRWLVIEDRAEVRRLAGIVVDWMRRLIAEGVEVARVLHMDRVVEAWEAGRDRVCREAPHVIVAHAPETDALAESAGIIALAYLELAAYSMGLGACWAGYFKSATLFYPPMAQALDLPAGHKILGAMMVGRPKYKYHRLPRRKEPPLTWR
ncbi:MAG: nitroreductase family protein [Thermodesulfobacteriota bacterium]